MKLRMTAGAVAMALTAMSSQAATPVQDQYYTLRAGDPLVGQQWYLQNTGQTAFSQRAGVRGIDLNLDFTHQRGIYGTGATIGVIDDGLEIAHPDLKANVVPGSYNFVTNTNDPTPSDPGASHGTSVAGIAAAVGFNGIGGRGIAPRASLKGYNWLSHQTLEAWMHSHGKRPGDRPLEAHTDVRIFNQSYGSSPLVSRIGNTAENLSLRLFDEAYEDVSRFSHWGRGAVFIKSAGNGYGRIAVNGGRLLGFEGNNGLPFNDSNIESTNNNYWNVVVSALNADGVRSSYTSVGANVLLTAPGGEFGTDSPAMVTTDLMGCDRGYNVNTRPHINTLHGGSALDPSCNFNGVMNGTSSAAPSASGSFALVMSANPALTARDVRHILVTTARKVDAQQPGVTLNFDDASGGKHSYLAIPGWQKNAAGLPFHQFYGFGLVDVDKAVETALQYNKPLPPLQQTSWDKVNVNAAIPDANVAGLDSIYTYGEDFTVEAVQVLVDANHQRVNDLSVELISPAGTRSVLLSPRNHMIAEPRGLNQHRLLSNHFYGENARGKWTLRVIDSNGGEYKFVYRPTGGADQILTLPNKDGRLNSWFIRFLGHRSTK